MSTTTAPDLSTVRVRSSNSLEEAVTHLGELKSHKTTSSPTATAASPRSKAEYTTEIDALDTAITRQMDGIGRYVDTARDALFGKREERSARRRQGRRPVGHTTAKINDKDA